MDPELAQRLAYAALAYPVLLFSLCFHEWGHAWSAKRLGDDTAESQGRLSMNPVVHMDPIGTVLFPLVMMISGIPFLFGWAKPVPVSLVRLRKMNDIVWVSLAGPACNLILFILGFIAFKIYVETGHSYDVDAWGLAAEDPIQNFLAIWISLNLLLMIFNLLPVTPLDGSKVLLAHIPGHARSFPFWQAYEQYGPFILIILLVTGGLWRIVSVPMDFIIIHVHTVLM